MPRPSAIVCPNEFPVVWHVNRQSATSGVLKLLLSSSFLFPNSSPTLFEPSPGFLSPGQSQDNVTGQESAVCFGTRIPVSGVGLTFSRTRLETGSLGTMRHGADVYQSHYRAHRGVQSGLFKTSSDCCTLAISGGAH